MAVGMLIAGAIGMGASAWKNKQAKDEAERQRNQAGADAARWEGELNRLKNNRPTLTNPYKDMTNSFANMKNPYAKLSNQYANLGVATQAAEFQAEQTDIALANTLDTLAMSGMGGGGATALAQAALQSKKGISASIQQQEAQNQKLSAQGAMDVQEKKAMGQMKVDEMIASGEEKVMLMQGQGKSEIMQIREARSSQDINNASGMQMNYLQMQSDAAAGMMQADIAQSNMFSSLGGQFLTAGLG